MNIFATNYNPVVCAQQHCDVHVIKMILETAQLLSTAHVVTSGVQVAYKRTHENHPCALWVRASVQNYAWAYTLLVALLDEYKFRFGKIHKTSAHTVALSHIPNLPDVGLLPHAQAMPDEYKHWHPHTAYKQYVAAKLQEWGTRDRPIRTTYTRRCVPAFLHTVCRPLDTKLAV